MKNPFASIPRRFPLALATALAATAAGAQVDEPATEDDAASGLARTGIEEIIVTATKREQNIQDVPIAVTALSEATIERAGVKDLRDLPTLSPSFNMNSSQTESQGTTLRIRGVGTTGNNIGLESAVGVFLDGVYLSRPGIALGDLMDLTQLEVLRGPQGTLFGRNTTAGALNIKTEKPDLEEDELWLNATVGNRDSQAIQAGMNRPLIEDVLAFRFAAAWRDQGGFVKSTTGAESFNRDRWLLRGQLYWTPTDDIDVRLIADFAKAKEECCDAPISFETPLVAAGAFAAAGLPADGGAPVSGKRAVKNRISNGEQFENPFRQWGVSLEINWDFDFAQLTYLPAYREFEASSVQNSDFVNLDVFTVPGDTGSPTFDDIKTFSQEIRLQGSFRDRVDWMVGFYYQEEDIQELQSLQLGSDYAAFISASAYFGGLFPIFGSSLDTIPLSLGGTFGDVRTAANPAIAFAGGVDPDGSFAINNFLQDAKGWSLFTHNTVHLIDGLDFTFGLRWIEETKTASFDQRAASSDACLNTLANAASPGLPSLVGAFTVGFMCFPFASVANVSGTPLPVTFSGRKFNDDELTYTVGLNYAITEDIMAYASFSHGFKAGGFNLDSTAAASGGDPRFLSEEVDASEVGVKSSWLDQRLRGNLAVFHMGIQDFQVLEFTGVRFQTFNVPSARATGAELELAANPWEGLELTASFTYQNARYPGNCNRQRALPAQVLALCGHKLTNAPEYVGTLGASYDGQLPWGGLRYFVSANSRIEADRRTSTQAVDPTTGVRLVDDIQEQNGKVNLRAGIGNDEQGWAFEVWSNNIGNKQTKNVTFNSPLRGISALGTAARGVFVEAPRTYGATLRLSF
jgi:outer membrane receptor protein involved in Fe transport